MISAGGFDFNERPFLVLWETTRACDLACVHCRASANPNPEPGELSRHEGLELVRQVHAAGAPILVFSGGDPLKRPDLPELIREAKKFRIRTGAIPAVTPALTASRIAGLKEAGLDQSAFSLDAAEPAEHDRFRRTEGVFNRTLEAVRIAQRAGLGVQINSLVNVHNEAQLSGLIDLIETLDLVFWEVFFLVPVGRGTELPMMEAAMFEKAFKKIYELNKRVNFIVKITEAPHYRRYYHEREAGGVRQAAGMPQLHPGLRRPSGPGRSLGQAPGSVNSGKGFAFVSYQGDVYPSGFLPLRAGNIRENALRTIYQDSPLFRDLRNASLLKGRCGQCMYREICGGSRSRAYAMTGDYLAEDPCCSYVPGAVAPGSEKLSEEKVDFVRSK